jgi:hypothetical protein
LKDVKTMQHMIMAVAYGEGSYGACDYPDQNQASVTCPATTANEQSGGGLANTGLDLLIIITIACLLIFVGLIVRLWRQKPAAKKRSHKQ